jgi:SAM-dependent methyltransferase
VAEYVGRVDRELEQRREGLAVLVALVPFPTHQAIRVLDVGTGQGLLASLLLDAYPNATAVGLDVSEPMRNVAAERMAGYGERFTFVLGDFVDGQLPREAFEVAVSSRAVHHLPGEHKLRLYRGIHDALRPGGAFFNLDGVAPSDERLRGAYRAARERLGGRESRGEGHHMPGHYFETLDDHVDLLRSAGFDPVDCFWKRLGLVLLGGFR